jgi:hypothetical protein
MPDNASNGSRRAVAADDPVIAALIALAAARRRLLHAEKNHAKADAAVRTPWSRAPPECNKALTAEAALHAAQAAEHRAVEAVFARRPRTTSGALALLAFALDTFEDYGIGEFDSADAIRTAVSIIGGGALSVLPSQKTRLH